jgi:hypothetical protein
MLVFWSNLNNGLQAVGEILNENVLTEWSIAINEFGILILMIGQLLKFFTVKINKAGCPFLKLLEAEWIYVCRELPSTIFLNCFME